MPVDIANSVINLSDGRDGEGVNKNLLGVARHLKMEVRTKDDNYNKETLES